MNNRVAVLLKRPISVMISLMLLLSGCGTGGNYAPVVDRDRVRSGYPGVHTVKRGETLYSIAWHHNMEFRQLATANGIASPFVIFPGQKLLLTAGKKVTSKVSKPRLPRKNREIKTGKNNSQSLNKNIISKKNTHLRRSDADTKKVGLLRWVWPAKGKVIRRFSASGSVHKGIDLRGKLGEPVHAANAGKVVYAGSGLVGYGKLLIVKHDKRYLSAYAHNSKLVVKEGQQVKAGQKIAEIGDTGTNTVKLHFEIRRDGKPINPLKLMPKRE